MLGEALTQMPGGSATFLGSLVPYHSMAKEKFLGVAAITLATSGAVSAKTAKVMPRGTEERFGSSLAVSITGNAGPSGGSAEKPVGTFLSHSRAIRI